MIIRDLQLETVCGVTSKLPVNALPEVAFAGHSNVGKSSLINALVGRKSFARTSSQPGKTQTLNFYKINNEIYFTDLPGYGYARVSMSLRQQWGKVIEKYFKTSKQLKCIILLVDIRHEPTKDDVAMFERIRSAGHEVCLVATKADKISKGMIRKQTDMLRKCLSAGQTPIIPFSAATKQGVDELWEYILAHVTDTLL